MFNSNLYLKIIINSHLILKKSIISELNNDQGDFVPNETDLDFEDMLLNFY